MLVNVKPLKTAEEIEDMRHSLLRFCSYRDYFLFVVGINTGLRVSDIVPLTVRDVKDKTHILLVEQKTGKRKEIKINPTLKKEIDKYIKGKNNNDYLFPSRKGNKPITTTQAYRVLVKAGEMADMDYIGTHTMRKTFGYHYYKKYKDIAYLMEIFNHAAPSITKRYIGITQQEIDESLDDFGL